jgi:hypothetical protein
MTQLAMPEIGAPGIRGDARVEGPLRWWLSRRWGPGAYALWVMHNPSFADADRNDPTMREVIHFTRAWGYDACMVANLYPFITPELKKCRAWVNSDDRAVVDQLYTNLHKIQDLQKIAAVTIVAWGAIADDKRWVNIVTDRLQGVHPFLSGPKRPLYCLGTTESGAPKHPMARGRHRIPRDQQPIVWRSAA